MISAPISRSAILAALLALPAAIHGQTFSSCDPIQKAGCPDDPALGPGTFHSDFTKGADDSVFSLLSGTKVSYSPSTGAVFSIQGPDDAPTMQSNKYIFFGRLDVEMQAAPGCGIVTSIVLQSDDLDEIDYEFVGCDTGHVQTNYFHQGNTTTYDRGATFAVASPMTASHTYSIVWTSEHIQWLYDGAVLRTLTYDDAYGGLTYPQTPMLIKLGTWVGGKDGTPKGTVDWAGGMVNWNDKPFNAYYKSVTVTDYSNGVANAVSYSYNGMSGTYTSIKVNTGNNIQKANPVIESASASATATRSITQAAPTQTSTVSLSQSPSSHPSLSTQTSLSSSQSSPSSSALPSTATSTTTTGFTTTTTHSSATTQTIASSVTRSSSILPLSNANTTIATSPTGSITIPTPSTIPSGAVGRISTSALHLTVLAAGLFLANMLL